MRWSKFKDKDPQIIFDVVQNYVFPAIKNMKNGKLPDFTEDGKIKQDDSDIEEGKRTWLNIKASKAFTVALADEAHMDVADFFGIASGNKIDDKFERTGYHAVKSDKVHAPIIEEFPVVMECELLEFLHTDYVDGIVGKIVNVKAEESVLSEKGKVDPAKLHALMFDQFQNGYYATGEKVGKAWNAGAYLMKK